MTGSLGRSLREHKEDPLRHIRTVTASRSYIRNARRDPAFWYQWQVGTADDPGTKRKELEGTEPQPGKGGRHTVSAACLRELLPTYDNACKGRRQLQRHAD